MRVCSIVLLTLLFSFTAHSRGGWVSSGGEVFQFDKNPWFVKNTTDVRYCIEHESAHFSADIGRAHDAIHAAINYWKDEFRRATHRPSGFAELGTQNFHFKAVCEGEIDLTFKLGYGTLTDEEVKYLDEPQRFVGVTVRTSEYDRVQMKASGFIFIASDKGPNAYRNSGHLISEAWTNQKLLIYALIHELGHVFGIPHNGVGIMSEVFLDQLLNKKLYQFYSDGPLKSHMHPPKEMLVCTLNGQFDAQFFRGPADHRCLKMVEAGSDKYQVYSLKDIHEELNPLGEVVISRPTAKDSGAKPVTMVHLPPEQKVFGKTEAFLTNYLIGPLMTDRGAKGFFRTSNSHRPYPLYLEVKPESVSMVGVVDDRMEPVFVYTPPTLLRLQLP